jgi:hypothetical protein
MDLRAAASRLPVDRAIDADMALHHGLTTLDRVLLLGGSARMAEERLERGAWLAPHRGVYRDPAAPRTPEQELLAAVLAAGEFAVASHLSAAWLWGLLVRPPDRPEVSVPYARSVKHTGIALHRSTDLLGVVPHERRAIPVTDPARTILDATGVVAPSVAALLVDRGISTKLVTVPCLTAALERYGRRGRRGSGKLRTELERRGVAAAGRTQTVLESRMARLARGINAPPPVAEHPVCGGRYRWDFAWPEVMVAVEVDGWDGHAAYEDWLRNIDKRSWGEDNGWLILVFAWEHLKANPEAVAMRIERKLAERTLKSEALPGSVPGKASKLGQGSSLP